MPMPKSKITRSRRGHRRSQTAISANPVHTCPTTGDLKSAHKAHKSSDGVWYYKGQPITQAKEDA